MTDTVHDPARLEALDAFRVLDTPPEQEFEDIVYLTGRLAGTPVALVSLVASDRQWFKARIGFPGCETGLNSSVCRFALDEPDLLVIPDLSLDARTRANPLVTDGPRIRFYAGAPLRTPDGVTLGSLCAIDVVPRPDGLSEQQREDMRVLARETMRHLETRRIAMTRRESDERNRALVHVGDRLRDLRVPAEMAFVAAEIMGRTLLASRAGYAALNDRRPDPQTVEADWCAPGVSSLVGTHALVGSEAIFGALHAGEIVIIPDIRTDARTAAAAATLEAQDIRALVNVPLVEQGRLAAIQFVHFDRPLDEDPEIAAFVRNVAERTRLSIARVRAEQQQLVVNQEISHRLKNTLSMVQAIAAQTLKKVTAGDAFEAFDQRLRTLSSAHDLLLAGEWTSADLSSVIHSVLDNIGECARCQVEGPPVKLGARATLSTSLLIHELATNALKYGALGSPSGTVDVRWRVENARDPGLILSWIERGGPEVSPPKRKGFGSRLLSMGLLGTGGAALSYGTEGFSATFTASLQQAQTA